MSLADLPDHMTIGEARALLREHVEKGAKCPVCRRTAKINKQKCDSGMASTLLKMYRAGAADDFVKVPDLPGDTHKGSQLAWWGLVEELKVKREDGGRAGWWKLTPFGARFAMREVSISKYAHVWDARVLKHSGPQQTIDDCLGDRFSWNELMGR